MVHAVVLQETELNPETSVHGAEHQPPLQHKISLTIKCYDYACTKTTEVHVNVGDGQFYEAVRKNA